MNYIVFDLEWNQSPNGQAGEHPRIPFEIIEIGAYKLSDSYEIIGDFRRLITPKIYKRLHKYIRTILNYDERELKSNGVDFKSACTDFLEWCGEGLSEGEEYAFCTWGTADLFCLQNNMDFYRMEKLPFPLKYFNIQQIFGEMYLKNSDICKLEKAVDMLKIEMDKPFHAAINDAYYTARVMQRAHLKNLKEKYTYDIYRHPKSKDEEILDFHNSIIERITMEYPSKRDAMSNKELSGVVCPKCGKPTKRRVKWFQMNGGNQVAVGKCLIHGNVMATIKFKPASDSRDDVFAIERVEKIKRRKYIELKDKREKMLEKKRIIREIS